MKVTVDKSRIPSEVTFFDHVSSIDIEKEDLFKLGIFKHEVPSTHIKDSDFLYLMSKVPAYIQLYSDFLIVEKDSIINTSKDDRVMKDVSEIVGIALGIKVTMESFGIRQEKIVKIPPPETKEKYLDYKFNYTNNEIELETKGTTSNSIKRFVDDITSKKSTNTKSHFRFGTVAILSKPDKIHKTVLHLCDDPPQEINDVEDDGVPWHYISALGFILDNKYYNKVVRLILEDKEPQKKLKSLNERFFGRYSFQGEFYFGEFFDYRINYENLSEVISGREQNIDEVFRKVTRKQGKNKIFIGVHSKIVEMIMKGSSLSQILELSFTRIKEINESGVDILRDSDGIIVVTSPNKHDPQIDEQFTEEEVRKRIGELVRLGRGEPAECGAPCRSREIEGKPCAIKTYRGTCHFHR